MFIFAHLVVVLAAVLHITCVLGLPVPFDDVEKAWKEGRSERDIHPTELPTPSFFHEARSDAALRNKVTEYMEAFDSALDERTMSAPWKVAKRGLSVVATVQNFMDKKIVEWVKDGELAERDEAPVLRPRVGRRWNF